MSELPGDDFPNEEIEDRSAEEYEEDQSIDDSTVLSRHPRSAERPKKPKKEHYTGGLDSLGCGRLP
ncbi:hypothetical protein N8H74_24455 [Pseudomonas sp. B2M1-30]|uniref:hypothetical protein n=1 Tax=Pseudomonas TaxID=286 RepID=UPI0021C8D290|nr:MULTISPECIES: hypothetical protein [Pseudomonas]MCU0121429.1 hypothetical protein [Pseudomonas sp. B2M1-30]MCU7263669.1 hypothetical protein [Pseudomonas koreensis]